MSNIDLSQMITAEVRDATRAQALLAHRKADCRSRILAVMDATVQINLSAAAAAGVLDPEDMATYRDALGWIAAMRAACPSGAWPGLPDGVADLASRF